MTLGNRKTLSQVMAELKEQGYRYEFEMGEEGKLKLRDLNKSFEPEEITLLEHFRFEGASNPSDMSILYTLKTNKGEFGVLVNGYGAYGDERIDAFLDKCASEEASRKDRGQS